MTTSQLNTNTIADFLEWNKNGQLRLNPDFQRRQVWSQPARVFLIDTILRGLSIPKFYIRSIIDLESKKSIREVVDGQQRLSAIIDFANDKFSLTKRAGEFNGYKYSTLPSELQENFLRYTLAVEHLVNASDGDVLEVFSRLNSYGETLNAAEKRHAQYQGDFKWSVHNLSKKYIQYWTDFKVMGLQQQVRMLDDSLVAQLYGIVLDGVRDGGDPYINKLYQRYDERFTERDEVERKVSAVIKIMTEGYGNFLKAGLGRSPQFLIFFAAVCHSEFGIVRGDIQNMPPRRSIKNESQVSSRLSRLIEVLTVSDTENMPKDLSAFLAASKSSTQRIKSREVRFKTFYNALTE